MKNEFKSKFSFDSRCSESKRILSKYENRIPIIVTKSKKSDIQKIDKNKFLVPEELTVGQFLFIIRKRLKIDSEMALFLLVNDLIVPPTSDTIVKIYNEHKDEDDFLYITYCGENTFGDH